ncbi:MAG: glycoside hydrolase family 3 C-terminal domain-containing protein, partial [Clostridia bacterium]|nr:glycoside hydrolase family 3 C-terminal domain-containing protein [Clostridia bacterium]
TGKPIILVLLSGSALAVTWADEHIDAIIQAWYPGADGGKALASLIFGEYSPSARLPVTFYKTTEELPDFRDYSMKNRTYRYMQNEALYPFGYGLSYTKFEYGSIKLDKETLQAGEDLVCSVKVKNKGTFESGEVVQLYLKDVEASVEVPRWQLRGIKKLHLKPGEEATAEFRLKPEDMALVDNEGRHILEPGKFEIFIGGSQPDARSLALTGSKVLKAEFDVFGDALVIDN